MKTLSNSYNIENQCQTRILCVVFVLDILILLHRDIDISKQVTLDSCLNNSHRPSNSNVGKA